MSGKNERILIFGGTTEGREIAEALSKSGIPCTVSVATEYGKTVMPQLPGTEILCGRKNAEEMAEMMQSGGYTRVVDATHPYAREASENIRRACSLAALPVSRIGRRTGAHAEGMITVRSLEEAAELLNGVSGNILILTGSRELASLCRGIRDRDRLYARVLPDPDAILSAREAGIPAPHIIGMQGPFSAEMNLAMIRQIQAKAILTKQSGMQGGFQGKMEAAREAGILAVIWQPAEIKPEPEGISPDVFLSEILQGWKPERILTLIGSGPGGAGCWTYEASAALLSADAVFGSRNVIERTESAGFRIGKIPVFDIYSGEGILGILHEHPEFRRPVALFSGDTGLYSGAFGVADAVRKDPEWHLRIFPGISAASMMAARTGIRLQECRIVSSHGRKISIIPHVLSASKTIVYTSGKEDAARVQRELASAVQRGILPGNTEMVLGANLSLPEETVRGIPLTDSCPELPDGLLVLLIRNPGAKEAPAVRILEDDELVRTDIPMTKRDIRILILAELGLRSGAVFWDIGSGTGSVSLQAALAVPDSEIYAVERNPEAADLTQKNLDRFSCRNVHVVRGSAPEVLDGLPDPTHVFLGGTGKSSGRILEAVLKRAPEARIAATCITLDTLSDLYQTVKKLPVKSISFRQIAVSRAKHIGSSDLMLADNPVFLFSCTGDPAMREERNA